MSNNNEQHKSSFDLSNAAFNEESDSTPASPYMGYHQPASAPADVIPSWATNSWGTTEWVFIGIQISYCVLHFTLIMFINVFHMSLVLSSLVTLSTLRSSSVHPVINEIFIKRNPFDQNHEIKPSSNTTDLR